MACFVIEAYVVRPRDHASPDKPRERGRCDRAVPGDGIVGIPVMVGSDHPGEHFDIRGTDSPWRRGQLRSEFAHCLV